MQGSFNVRRKADGMLMLGMSVNESTALVWLERYNSRIAGGFELASNAPAWTIPDECVRALVGTGTIQ